MLKLAQSFQEIPHCTRDVITRSCSSSADYTPRARSGAGAFRGAFTSTALASSSINRECSMSRFEWFRPQSSTPLFLAFWHSAGGTRTELQLSPPHPCRLMAQHPPRCKRAPRDSPCLRCPISYQDCRMCLIPDHVERSSFVPGSPPHGSHPVVRPHLQTSSGATRL